MVEKYRALAAELNDIRAKLKTGEQRLSHLRAAILMFDPHFRFSTVPIKRIAKPCPEMSERTRLTWDVLRTAPQPMTAHGIAKEVLALIGAEHVDSYMVEKAAAGVYAFLAR